jgi:hypothetical protein
MDERDATRLRPAKEPSAGPRLAHWLPMGDPTANTEKTAGTGDRTSSATGSVKAASAGGASVATRAPAPRSLLDRVRPPIAPRAPRLWFEILLIGVSYWLYSVIRNEVPAERATAMRNADRVWALENHLGLGIEHSINHAVNSVTWLIVGMNYYYATLHFCITIGVLVWLYVWHPGRFGAARLALFGTTWLALVGFYAFPLAPPRLMAGGGFIDTVLVHHTWGSLSNGKLSDVSNQYAAMPSMHIGWSLWCGIAVMSLARPVWVKVLGGLYPVFTLLVIISTANHFWLDAVGGACCLAAGYALAYGVYGHWVYRLPRFPPPRPGRVVARSSS